MVDQIRERQALSLPAEPVDLWAALEAAMATPARPAGSVTVAEYAKRFGISESQARRRMNAAIGKGQLTAVAVLIDSALTKCYSPCLPMTAPAKTAKRSDV